MFKIFNLALSCIILCNIINASQLDNQLHTDNMQAMPMDEIHDTYDSSEESNIFHRNDSYDIDDSCKISICSTEPNQLLLELQQTSDKSLVKVNKQENTNSLFYNLNNNKININNCNEHKKSFNSNSTLETEDQAKHSDITKKRNKRKCRKEKVSYIEN